MLYSTKKQVLAATEPDGESEEVVHRDLDTKLRSVDNSHPAKNVLRLLANVRELYAMLRDHQYHLATRSKAIIIAALVYFIMPVDMIPDYIPLVGYVDDGMVLAAVMRVLVDEIDAYRMFRKHVASTEGRHQLCTF